MKFHPPSFSKAPTKFRMPTADNLIPIRLNIEVDGQRLKDAFTWNPSDPDSEVVYFSRRTVKDLKLPPAFTTHITQSIQSQLAEFRSFEGQDMQAIEKIVPLKDISNFENDPEEFSRTLCKDLNIEDPEAVPAITGSIRKQVYEVIGKEICYKARASYGMNFYSQAGRILAVQNVASAKEYRMGKKGRQGPESVTSSKSGNGAIDVLKLFGSKGSVIRKRKEWHVYEPTVDILSTEEVGALDAREERNACTKKKLDDKEDSFQTH